jgi:hypothetical protein
MRRVNPCIPVSLLILLAAVGCGGKSYAPSLQLADFNLGEVLDGHLRRVEQSMSRVRGLDSAEAAAQEIHYVNQDLADLVYNAPRLSGAGQAELAKLAAGHLGRMQRLSSEVNESPALAEILGPELEQTVVYLQVMASGRYEDAPS